ncbi:phytanoyl-CoA dioxygenase family protein [Limnobacter sp.]|uniref:phytanoyl-CoA dioxygenase family protein n=1 Tax=Limnobacter sp. TaxID=2003368 RepID=UPI002FE07894
MIFSAVRDPYPTRDKSEGALIRRTEPVVYSKWADSSPLKKEQLAQFEHDGYLVLTDVFSAHELDGLRAAAERVSKNCAETHPGQLIKEASEDADDQQLRTLFGVHGMEGLLQDTASNPHMLEVIQFLLGDQVYIHQSRLNFKSPHYGSGFEWHSDFETWHAEDGMPGMRAISATVLLTDEVSADGSLKFMPRSHKTFVACPGETPETTGYREAFKKQAVGKPPALFLSLLEENGGVQEVVAPAGSVLLFDCNVMHGAGKNTSEHLRANLFYVYNALSNTLNAPYAADEPRPEFLATRKVKPLMAQVPA